MLTRRRGAVEARRAHNPKVAGSNPAAATSLPPLPEGVPERPPPASGALSGGIAQVVEQPAHTRYVPGSIPGTATAAAHGSDLPPGERVAAVARIRRSVARSEERRRGKYRSWR